MRITVEEELAVADLLRRIASRYGTRRALEKRVRDRPRDHAARVALHDLDEYADARPDERVREVRHVVIPDDALDRLTLQRLRLLLQVKSMGGRVEGTRALARALRRDIKNVSEDVEALAELDLLHVHPGGRGRPSVIVFPAVKLDLHLVEA